MHTGYKKSISVIVVSGIVLLLACMLSGCINREVFIKNEDLENTPRSSVPRFDDIYQTLLSTDDTASQESFSKDKLLTVSVNQMPLREFLIYINGQIDASIICDMDLDDKPVTIDVVDMGVGEVLSAVARRCGADIIVQDNLYYIGNLQDEDRGFLVRKVRRLIAEDIEKVLSSLISDLGKVFASADGLIVVGDKVRVLQRINSMLDDVERQPANTWIVQMYLIAISNKGERDIGVDTALDAELTADFKKNRKRTHENNNSVSTENGASSITDLDISSAFAKSGSKVVADAQFRAILKAARTSTDFTVMAEPMMLVVDGGEAKISDGEKIPIPQKAVSDSGTITTIGYEYIDTGIVVNAGIREMTQSTASCNLSVEITQINGYVEGSPITTGQAFSTNTVLESGGTYLVGSMSKKATTKKKSGAFFTTYYGKNFQDGTIMIWLRCYRIHGPYRERG